LQEDASTPAAVVTVAAFELIDSISKRSRSEGVATVAPEAASNLNLELL